jgi:hypothetical protein
VADGTNEGSAYAARIDAWVAREAEEKAAGGILLGGTAKFLLAFFSLQLRL